jgi:molecular chaperone GrpE (heat shock protein)
MWRRECRRVRNRESAAASRARVRDRIQELEVEVEDWKTKYAQAVQRLENLQQIQSSSAASNGSI